MKTLYSQQQKVAIEGDTLMIGKQSVKLLKHCGDLITFSNEKQAKQNATEFFSTEYFYGTSNHLLIAVNCQLFAASKI